jgi:hypothetical protein
MDEDLVWYEELMRFDVWDGRFWEAEADSWRA